jgi:two-component system, cell cycle sensor histidine kinase and response regulator CckA
MEAVGTLSSGIAHDFNNILNIITGNLSLIENNPTNGAKFQRRLEGIKKATDRATRLVKQLLTFARKSDIERRTVEINDLVAEVARLLEETFPKTIKVRLNLGTGLPLLNADPNQLHQVLLNLCVNARDAMPAGGEFWITTGLVGKENVAERFPAAQSEQYIAIRLRDSGIGMDERTLKQIFDPFFTTKGVGGGTGLGLAVALGIVEKHTGFIDVLSKPGSGTEFSIYLPLSGRAEAVIEETTLKLGDAPGGDETILFIEDEAEIRETAVEVLEGKGYTVLTAKDGEEGVGAFKNNADQIALVLSDRGLPGIDGEEVFQRLRSINPRVRFVLLTGFIPPEKRSELLSQGINSVLQKPYKIGEVLLKIREALDKDSADAQSS